MKQKKEITIRDAVALFLHKYLKYSYSILGQIFRVTKQAAHKWLTGLSDVSEGEWVDVLSSGGRYYDAYSHIQVSEDPQRLMDGDEHLKYLIKKRIEEMKKEKEEKAHIMFEFKNEQTIINELVDDTFNINRSIGTLIGDGIQWWRPLLHDANRIYASHGLSTVEEPSILKDIENYLFLTYKCSPSYKLTDEEKELLKRIGPIVSCLKVILVITHARMKFPKFSDYAYMAIEEIFDRKIYKSIVLKKHPDLQNEYEASRGTPQMQEVVRKIDKEIERLKAKEQKMRQEGKMEIHLPEMLSEEEFNKRTSCGHSKK